jgi:hypothetical protein
MPYVVAMAFCVLGSRLGRAWVGVVLSAAFGFVFCGQAYMMALIEAGGTHSIEAAITLAYGAACFMTTVNIFVETRQASLGPRRHSGPPANQQGGDGAAKDPALRPWKEVPMRKAARSKLAAETTAGE